MKNLRRGKDDTIISVRIDSEMLNELDRYWRLNLYRDRTSLILDLISKGIESIRCPYCGATNPKGGHVCSVCLRRLHKPEDDADLAAIIDAINSHPELMDRYFGTAAQKNSGD